MMKERNLCYKIYKSARLRSLPLSMAGILMGSGLGITYSNFDWNIFCIAILTAILLQLLSDYANDYGDYIKGVDNDYRQGPKRALQSGILTPSEMKRVIVWVVITTFISICSLIWFSFGSSYFLSSLVFLFLGIGAIYAAIKYTMGRGAYGYYGLGDLFVFIFFGIVSVVGSAYLYVHLLDWSWLLPAASVGLLSMAVLNLNNLRDLTNDKAMGKRTIPVRIGEEYARMYHYFLIVVPMVLMMCYSLITFELGKKVLYILSFIPLGLHFIFIRKNKTPKGYDSQLKVVALSTFLMSLLFFLGQIL